MNIRYIKPLGDELQHELLEDSICLHTDVFLLMNLQNLSVAERIADDVIDRFKSPPDSPDSFTSVLSKSTDGTLFNDTMDYTSRYDCTLNSQRSRVLSKLKQIDDYQQSLKDSKQSQKLKIMKDRMQKYFEEQFGIDDAPSNSSKSDKS